MDARLALPAAGAWAAAAIGVLVPAPGLAAVAAWAAAVVVIAVGASARWRRSIASTTALMLAAAALVLTSAAAGQQMRTATGLVPGEPVVALVEVTAAAEPSFGGERFRATLVTVERPDGAGEVGGHVPVLVFAQPGEAPLEIGDRVRVQGRAEPAEASAVAWLIFADDAARVDGAASPLVSAAAGLRAGFTELAGSFGGDGGALLPGLAIGDTSSVDPVLEDAMRASGLSHLTAVSGANCAIVVAGAMLLGGLLRLPRWARIVLAALLLAGFVVLVTPQPSVLRAAVMALVVLGAAGSGRGGAGLAALCLTVVVLLAIDPWLALEYGFALSVLATAGLLLLAAPLTRRLSRRMPAPVAAVLAVPIAAQAACQPVLVLLDPTLSLTSIPANVLAAPAAPLATVLGLAACLLVPVAPALAGAPAWLAWLAGSYIASVAHLFAAVPARLPWLPGAAGAVLAATVLALVLLGATLRRRLPLLAGVTAAGAVVLLLGAGSLGVVLSRPADWAVAACDVGQGSATLLRGSDGVALVDTGDEPRLLRRCLDDLGIDRVDVLVLTHFDRDHVGAVDEVVGRVSAVLVGPTDGEDDERIVQRLQAGGAEVERASIGDRVELGDLRWSVLWPRANEQEPGNDASITLLADVAGVSVLLLGDLGEEAQNRVLRRNPLPQVDVVAVAHHGSADQSPALYERARAAVALVSVGAGNDYGHPAPSLLDLLARTGSAAYRTDRDGTVLISAASDGLRVWSGGGRVAPRP